MLCIAVDSRRHRSGGFAAAALLALLANAAITGGLSGPHDRYQSRIMWLPPLIACGVLQLASRCDDRPRAFMQPMKQQPRRQRLLVRLRGSDIGRCSPSRPLSSSRA